MDGAAKTTLEDILFTSQSCVLATASLAGKPEAATVDYYADEAYHVYFSSFAHYRKYANLESNPQASIVITRELMTIQMDGTVVQLEGHEATHVKEKLLEKIPDDIAYLTDPDALFFRFTPNWARILIDDGSTGEYFVVIGE